jgi:hypothetical protein
MIKPASPNGMPSSPLKAMWHGLPRLFRRSWPDTQPAPQPALELDIDLDRLCPPPQPHEWLVLQLDPEDESRWMTQPGVRPRC